MMMNHRTFAAAATLAAGVLPATLTAQSARDLFKVHGYATQGYGESTDIPYIGIPTNGTADYRTAALQLRSDFTRHDEVTVQLRNRRFGASVLNDGQPPVELSWAFYEHKFPGVAVKLGRMPMPRGIYNEIRSVGTLLPFYRAPLNLYSEGQETIDGGSVAGSFDVQGFSVDLAGYTGRFTDESTSYPRTGTPFVRRRSMTNTFGVQTWVNTPIPGVRVGLGGLRYTRLAADTGSRNTEESRVTASLDAAVSRVSLRSEFSHAVSSSSRHQAYVQTGVRVFRGLSLNAQQELSYRIRFAPSTSTTNGVTTVTPAVRTRELQDLAVGASYALRPNLVFKFEQHAVKGTRFDQYMNSRGPAGESKYFLASVSTAF